MEIRGKVEDKTVEIRGEVEDKTVEIRGEVEVISVARNPRKISMRSMPLNRRT